MSTEILPCPFCGGECMTMGLPSQRWAYCTTEDDCGYCGTNGDSEADAIAAHNTVAAAVRDHAAVVAERDALRAQVAQLRRALQPFRSHAAEYVNDYRMWSQGLPGANGAAMRVRAADAAVDAALAATAPKEAPDA